MAIDFADMLDDEEEPVLHPRDICSVVGTVHERKKSRRLGPAGHLFRGSGYSREITDTLSFLISLRCICPMPDRKVD